jgi:hypothetical protein
MKALPGSIGEYFALPPSDYCNSRTLVAGTGESIPVPTGAKYAMFASTGDFFASYDKVAAVPADVADGTASELNPTMRYVNGVLSIGVIAAADTTITVSFFM